MFFNAAKQKYTLAYEEYVNNKDYNQLFRNQLIAEALLQNKKYDQVYTGLFCYEEDHKAIDAGNGLRNSLKDKSSFTVMTYRDFIYTVQQLDLSWEQREWTMLLWGRYCGLGLIAEVIKFLK